mmetsp:Transcript_17104/g.54598  ORF Transcript_17104/g.54598 Transcript_17104/m.54598 type:complete len:212 (-) Transcript_17104:219-854(-)
MFMNWRAHFKGIGAVKMRPRYSMVKTNIQVASLQNHIRSSLCAKERSVMRKGSSCGRVWRRNTATLKTMRAMKATCSIKAALLESGSWKKSCSLFILLSLALDITIAAMLPLLFLWALCPKGGVLLLGYFRGPGLTSTDSPPRFRLAGRRGLSPSPVAAAGVTSSPVAGRTGLGDADALGKVRLGLCRVRFRGSRPWPREMRRPLEVQLVC